MMMEPAWKSKAAATARAGSTALSAASKRARTLSRPKSTLRQSPPGASVTERSLGSNLVQGALEVFRQGRGELLMCTIRQSKTKTAGMEKLPLEIGIGWMFPAIDAVTYNRMSDERKMDPDLVCASGFDRNLEQRGVRKSLDHTKMSHRWPARANDRHPLSVLRVATNRCVDRCFAVFYHTGN